MGTFTISDKQLDALSKFSQGVTAKPVSRVTHYEFEGGDGHHVSVIEALRRRGLVSNGETVTITEQGRKVLEVINNLPEGSFD